MAVTAEDFRKTLGSFATGVTIVTSLDEAAAPIGLTVNSFTSVSLEPRLVLFCLDKHYRGLEAFRAAGCFAVNVLAESQKALSMQFATSEADRWNGTEWRKLATGAPVLSESLAVVDCTTEAIHDGGDHLIFIGLVAAAEVLRDAEPLLYYRGQYSKLTV